MVWVWRTKSDYYFFLRYDPPIVFRRQSHFITFIFIKTMSYDILVQMAYSSWIHIFVAFSLKRVTCEFKQFTNSEVQRSPWSVFRKPQFFHTFSVILILSNYRKCMGKPRFSKNWSRTSLRSRFSVLFLWTRKLIFSKKSASTIWWLDALKRIEKIIRENAFEQKKKKPRLKFNP